MANYSAPTKGGKIRGATSDDTVLGSGVKDVLYGLGGADTIRGGLGNDTIYGDGKSTFKEAFQQVGQVIVPIDPMIEAAKTLTLDSMGMLDGESVWRVRNATDTAQVFVLRQAGTGEAIKVEIPPRSDFFVGGMKIDAYELYVDGQFIDAQKPNEDAFNGNAEAIELEAGGDTIFAGAGNDWVDAGAGDDVVYGDAGNDSITGGAGADKLNGGSGNDTADYLRSSEGVYVSISGGYGKGGDAQGDSIINIENLRGSGFADVLEGNDFGNRLNGMAGADELYGQGGNDWIITGGGYDRVDGGAGQDTVSYEDSWAGVDVNLATGAGRYGSASRDSYVSIENVSGSKFADRLAGDTANNRLTGGAGADSFVFEAKFGYDRIADFKVGDGDVVALQGVGFDDFADVLANAVDSANGAVISIAGHGKITLMGVAVNDLHADDFLFA
jgi:Ca2+-binding RTX toxin-like protein